MLLIIDKYFNMFIYCNLHNTFVYMHLYVVLEFLHGKTSHN
jgi:hypothetical protein